MHSRTRLFTVALAGAAFFLPTGSAAVAAPVTADGIVAEAARYGIDARPLLEQRVVVGARSLTVRDVIDVITSGKARSGPAGTPEIQVGNVIHGAFTAGFGAQRPYTVTQSAVVPATEALIAPVPGTPATSPFAVVSWGGPVVQVKGAGYTGAHVVGGPVFNASTDSGGSDGIWLSGRSTGTVSDSAIDYTGHAGVLVNQRFCLLGYCAGVGVLIGDGVAIFDSAPLVAGTPKPETPTLP